MKKNYFILFMLIILLHNNRASGQCSVSINYLFVISDLTGRKIVSEILNGKEHHASLKTDHLRSGTYFYEIFDGNKQVKNDKLIIIK